MKKITLFLFLLISITLFADTIQDFTVKDISGKEINLYTYLEKGPVIIDFWATWCKPCLKELPKVEEIANKYKNVTLIAISVDKPKDAVKVKTFVKSNKYKFITIHDTSKDIQKRMNVTQVPRTLIIDPAANIVFDHEGYVEGDEVHIEKIIAEMMLPHIEPPVEEEQIENRNQDKEK